ncbi:MAG TPA: hypothetical protein VM912_05340 [Terriglobales bacterium]|nr:hypothetical protein [Terriglobales bacterium]
MREPERLFLASDANASGLLETAWKATRKPTRGGVANLICIAEPLDVLAQELSRVADRVTVVLPWGSLLRAVAAPEIASLRQIANLCLPCASLEIVFSYDPQRDLREGARLGLSLLNDEHITSKLPRLYEEAGLSVASVEEIPLRELAKYETTWAKRLATGRCRDVWRIQARSSHIAQI